MYVRSNSFVLFSFAIAIKFVPVLLRLSQMGVAVASVGTFQIKFPRQRQSLNYYFRRFVKLKRKKSAYIRTSSGICDMMIWTGKREA